MPIRVWAACALLSLAAGAVQSEARVLPEAPHYYSIDDAVARSDGFWALTHTTPERRVRATSVGLSCIERAGAFSVVWLSVRGESAYCSYTPQNRRGGSALVIYAQLRPDDVTLDDLVRDEENRGGPNAHRETQERNVGRCRGVLMRTTIDPATGRYPNGRAWRTRGRHDIVYALERSGRAVEIRLRSEGPPPYYESDVEVIQIAEASLEC
jgi:hypothetical protein